MQGEADIGALFWHLIGIRFIGPKSKQGLQAMVNNELCNSVIIYTPEAGLSAAMARGG
jgi:hypothetical protein